MNHNLRRCSFQSTQYQYGLTLIEIMVALVISAFLLAGVIQLFVGTKQTYRGHDALSRIQENGRFAIDRMAWDLRMAGYINPMTDPIPVIDGLNGSDGTANNDIITVQWNDGADNFREYSLMCQGGTDPPCGGQPASLAIQLLQPPPANRQALIEGVERMQIRYGVCTGGIVTVPYVNATSVTDWNDVCSIQIDLLLVSIENNLVTEPQTYFYAGNMTTATDRRFRQAFSTTIAIRNRMLR